MRLEPGRAPASLAGITERSLFRYFRTSPKIIRLAVMLYIRLPLSLRNVEDLLHERRIEVSYETAIRTDQVIVVPDTTQDKRFAANPLVTGEPFIRFYAGAPLVYLQGVRLGALCLLDPRPRQPAEFTLGDKAELIAMADEVVSVIVRQELAALSAILGQNES